MDPMIKSQRRRCAATVVAPQSNSLVMICARLDLAVSSTMLCYRYKQLWVELNSKSPVGKNVNESSW